MASNRTVIGFDLYGTLLSTESIAQQLAAFYGDEKARVIATQARRYQLEYSWRISCMGLYRPFSDLTRASFRHATAEAGVKFSTEQEDEIMNAYNRLAAFPEVDGALDLVSRTPSLDPWVFSNGTKEMITSSLSKSPSLSKVVEESFVRKVVSVDELHELKVFKPDRRTYEFFCREAGREDHPEQVWLVSSNPFDVAGAAAAGLKTVWVDRGGAGWVDGLGDAIGVKPTVVVKGVDEAVQEILKTCGKE